MIPPSEYAGLLTIEEAARCITHRQTGAVIRPVTLRAWIAEARRIPHHSRFQDQRPIKKEGATHHLSVAQIEALLIGRPYMFVSAKKGDGQDNDAPEIMRLEGMLHSLQTEYQNLLELWQQLHTLESFTATSAGKQQVSKRDRTSRNDHQGHKASQVRDYWVGHGDCHGYFALFVNVYLAHGLGKRSAGHRGEKAKQDIQQGLPPRYPLTVIADGAKGNGDQLVVTEQQASRIIINLHFELGGTSAGTYNIPAMALCRDPRCPVCPHVAHPGIETLPNVIEEQR